MLIVVRIFVGGVYQETTSLPEHAVYGLQSGDIIKFRHCWADPNQLRNRDLLLVRKRFDFGGEQGLTVDFEVERL